MLEFKGYVGSVGFSSEDDVFHGKLEGISDLVTYEGTDVEGLKQAFYGAVDDYITSGLIKKVDKQRIADQGNN